VIGFRLSKYANAKAVQPVSANQRPKCDDKEGDMITVFS